MTAPERIHMKPNDMYENGWGLPLETDPFDEDGVEYVRADLVPDPAAIREAALREAAYVARNACLVPPDGGNPTEAERLVCEEAFQRILALIEKEPKE